MSEKETVATPTATRSGTTPAQRKRSVAIALVLAAMAVLFFAVTLVQLSGNVAKRMQNESGATDRVYVPETSESTQ